MSKRSLYQVVGGNVQWLRKQKHLTQFELSEISGVDRSYLAKLECGRANPSIDTLCRLAEALCVPVYNLLKCGLLITSR